MKFDEAPIDFSDMRQTSMFINAIRGMQGVHRVSIVQWRPRRSDRQNRYYWPAFVQPFADFLREQGEVILDEEVHEMFKAKFLRRAIKSPSTGETIGYAIRSTTALTTVEFNDYLDRIAHWLADMFHIVVPEPGVYRECGEAA